jgi:hypothetical protein
MSNRGPEDMHYSDRTLSTVCEGYGVTFAQRELANRVRPLSEANRDPRKPIFNEALNES